MLAAPLAAHSQIDGTMIEAEEALADAEAAKAEARESRRIAEEDKRQRDRARSAAESSIQKARAVEAQNKKEQA